MMKSVSLQIKELSYQFIPLLRKQQAASKPTSVI